MLELEVSSTFRFHISSFSSHPALRQPHQLPIRLHRLELRGGLASRLRALRLHVVRLARRSWTKAGGGTGAAAFSRRMNRIEEGFARAPTPWLRRAPFQADSRV